MYNVQICSLNGSVAYSLKADSIERARQMANDLPRECPQAIIRLDRILIDTVENPRYDETIATRDARVRQEDYARSRGML